MVLDWLAKGKAAGLPDLLAKKQFGKAFELARDQLKARPRDGRLRLQFADTLVAAGRGKEAVPFLRQMAEELAEEGFAAKAIAILKRVQKIEPGRVDIERRLASLIAEHTRREATRRARRLRPRRAAFPSSEWRRSTRRWTLSRASSPSWSRTWRSTWKRKRRRRPGPPSSPTSRTTSSWP